jgi:hypothetical protein
VKHLDDIWETSGRHLARCVHNHQMGSGPQITLFGECSFRIPSCYLPDFTRGQDRGRAGPGPGIGVGAGAGARAETGPGAGAEAGPEAGAGVDRGRG